LIMCALRLLVELTFVPRSQSLGRIFQYKKKQISCTEVLIFEDVTGVFLGIIER
jgi:hypothetical protein